MLLLNSCLSLAQRAPDSPFTFAGFVEPDFPFITTTLSADSLGAMYPDRNRIARCLALQLGNDAYACFDTDLLRVAAAWTGDFISLLSMPQVSYHKAGNKVNGVPEVLGDAVAATGVYPGWQGREPVFEDHRPEGPNPAEAGRGPIPANMGRWNGVSVVGDRSVLRYEVSGAQVAEMLTSVSDGEEVGIVRSLEIGGRPGPLTLVLGEFRQGSRMDVSRERLIVVHPDGETVTAIGISGDTEDAYMSMPEGRYAVVHLARREDSSRLRVVMWKGWMGRLDAFDRMLGEPADLPDYRSGGPTHWEEVVATKGRLGELQGAYAIDELTLPLPNPWQRNIRVSGLDFFDDGRAALSTFEGDVWLVDGIDAELRQLTWRRFASGLSEPMSLSIVDGKIYVFGREGIVRLNDVNGDGEADFYENFSNLPIQTGESREYPLSMHALPGGGFVLSKGGALNAGPRTNPPIMNGFRAGGPHSGSILKVSADGRTVEYVATGLREPYIGVHPETGWITASDQQGNFVPSTPIYLAREGDYFGVPATAHRTDMPETARPLTWVPHTLDPSAAEQVWITSDRMGPLNGALVHLSYGKPAIYRVYHDDELKQGGIAEIPLLFDEPLMKGRIHPSDGLLYVSGFQVWDSHASEISGFRRIRYAGGSLPLPIEFRAGSQGVVMRFEQALNPTTALNLSSYLLERWEYHRTDEYGSGHFTPAGLPGHEAVRVQGVSISDDHRSVFLHVVDMDEVMQMGLSYRLETSTGDPLIHDIYFTLNQPVNLDLAAAGFSDVLLSQSSTAAPAQQTLVTQTTPTIEMGEQLYMRIGCVACHSTDGSVEGRSGPTFKGLFGSNRRFVDGSSAVADEAYLRQSILDPSARVVEGKEVEMPSYVGVLSENEIASLLLFIESLQE